MKRGSTSVNRCRLAMAVAWLLCTAAAMAARLPADCQIEAGFDGIVGPSGTLFPVTVTIGNRVAGTTGTIEISHPQSSARPEVTYILPFTTPAPSLKKFVLLVRAESRSDLRVNVDFKDHLKPLSQTIELRSSQRPLVLCVGIPRGYKTQDLAAKYSLAAVGPAACPDDPLALDGVHAMMISGAAFGNLARGQLDALARWVNTGGTLILIEPLSEDSFLKNVEIVTGTRDSAVLNLGVHRCGAGLLASSGMNASPDIAFWAEDKALAGMLFPELELEEDPNMHGGEYGAFSQLCQGRRTRGWSGFFWILLIVSVYIVVIGPIDWLVCRKLRRPHLTWVIFPVAIVAFSLLAYSYSRMVNIGTMLMVHAAVLDTTLDGSAARGNSIFWIYSAKNAAYEIDAPTPDVCFSGRESAMGAGAVARVDILNGRKSQITARIPVFSGKDFDAGWYAPWPHRITVEKRDDGIYVTPPPALKIRAVSLADSLGLIMLQRAGDSWVGSGTWLPWSSALSNCTQRSHQNMYYGGYRGSDDGDDRNLLPDTRKLDDYLMLVSFGSLLRKKEHGMGEVGVNFRFNHNNRENSLDIARRLTKGRVLLLFMEPKEPVLPVNINRHWPATAQASLVRIQIPELE